MTIEDKIRDGKLQYDINREVAKILALSFGKIDTYEYLTVKGLLLSNQSQIIVQAKFTYFSLGKALEKQTEKQVDALKSLNLSSKTDELKQIEGIFPKNLFNDLIISKFTDIIQLQGIKSNKLDLHYLFFKEICNVQKKINIRRS